METLLELAKCTPREPAYAASTKMPPGQFSLDIQVELLHIPRRIGSVGSLKGVCSGVKRRNIAGPSKRKIEIRTERPVRRAIQGGLGRIPE